MKKNILKRISHFLIISFSSFLIACELETSNNGDLDGFWHLVEVDTLSTGGVNDLHQSTVFWSFQMDLLQFTGPSKYFARFSHDNGQLIVNEPHTYNTREGNQPIIDISILAPWGINAQETQFRIEHLSGSKMTLNDGTLRLQFIKM